MVSVVRMANRGLIFSSSLAIVCAPQNTHVWFYMQLHMIMIALIIKEDWPRHCSTS